MKLKDDSLLGVYIADRLLIGKLPRRSEPADPGAECPWKWEIGRADPEFSSGLQRGFRECPGGDTVPGLQAYWSVTAFHTQGWLDILYIRITGKLAKE